MSRRIGTVLRIRDLQERLARAEVARCQAEVAAAAARQEVAWRLLDRRQQAVSGPFDARGIAARHLALDGGVAAALRAARHAADAETVAAGALARWTVAARDHDGVERLAGRLSAAERENDDRRAAIALDELVVQRHGGRDG